MRDPRSLVFRMHASMTPGNKPDCAHWAAWHIRSAAFVAATRLTDAVDENLEKADDAE